MRPAHVPPAPHGSSPARLVVAAAAGWMAAIVAWPSAAEEDKQEPRPVPDEPFAVVEVIDDPAIDLVVTSFGEATSPTRIRFRVFGLGPASIVLEPAAHLDVRGRGRLGRATSEQGSLGFDLVMTIGAAAGRTRQVHLRKDGRTDPVDLMLEPGRDIEGEIRIRTDTEWTPDGALPRPGTYEGRVLLTVMAAP